jgi:hypothetical protein
MCTRFSGLEPPESAIRDLCFPSLVETCFLDVPLGACMGISASASTIGYKVFPSKITDCSQRVHSGGLFMLKESFLGWVIGILGRGDLVLDRTLDFWVQL